MEEQTQKRGRRRHGRSKHGSGSYSGFNVGNDNYKTRGRVSKRDGRLNISLNETNNRGYLAKALGGSFLKNIGSSNQTTGYGKQDEEQKQSRSSSEITITSDIPRPKLNIVVMVM